MKLEEQLRRKIRLQGKAESTADAYWQWVHAYLMFVKGKGDWVHPRDLSEDDFERWLTHLANDRNVAANTQNQAFSAVCYLYRHVLGRPLENVSAFRSKRPDRVREVLDQSEIIKLFEHLDGKSLLVAQLMYACSFRIGEVGRIRVKDVSFERKHIIVRGGKGEKDRIVGLPEVLHDSLQRQMESARLILKDDIASGRKGVSLPKAWSRKSSSAHLDWPWWYVFPSGNYSACPRTGEILRHHIDMGNIARIIKNAARSAEIPKRVTSHCLRHSFATHSIESGVPIHVVQKILGHNKLETTENYLHVSKDGVTSAKSPLESTVMLRSMLSGQVKQKQVQEDKPRLKVFAG